MARPYHHGNLRRAVLDGALAAIAEHGAGALSLRDVARRAGVSHAAPAHHFGDKAGVLTAIAIEGFTGLAQATRAAAAAGGDIVDGGLAWISFAIEHPAHYEVMFRPDLYRQDDPELLAVRAAGSEVLAAAVRRTLGPGASDDEVASGMIAALTFGHGFASLWTSGNAPPDADPLELARRAAVGFVRLVQAGA